MSVTDYFAAARERYAILLRRRAGLPRPWTNDPVFKEWKFTCVHREDDRTTTWLRENVRDPQAENPVGALMSTVAFRWFNRIETGEKLLPVLLRPDGWDLGEAAAVLDDQTDKIFTAAYIIRSDFGERKVDSVARAIENIYADREKIVAEIREHNTLEHACEVLTRYHLMGSFMAYEVVSDLRWTCLLRDAVDIMSWACPGPGAARGLGRALYDDVGRYNYTGGKKQKEEMLDEMRELLEVCQDPTYWPRSYRKWEMREVEHWLCEYDKLVRARSGEGRPKQRFYPHA
jgi:hypothetical protein